MSAPAEVHPIIVVGYDGSPASGVALDRAVERVGSTGRLYVVIAWRPPTGSVTGQGLYQSKMGQARADVEAVVEAARKAHPALDNVAWEPKLIARPAPQAIADVATTRAADEIILGTRGFGRVRALLGSVAHEVIHLASCPVTVIPERMLKGEAAGGGVEAGRREPGRTLGGARLTKSTRHPGDSREAVEPSPRATSTRPPAPAQ